MFKSLVQMGLKYIEKVQGAELASVGFLWACFLYVSLITQLFSDPGEFIKGDSIFHQRDLKASLQKKRKEMFK